MGAEPMERRSELGRLVIAPEVVAQIAARLVAGEPTVVGLVRPGAGAGADTLSRRHRHRAVLVQEQDGIWLVTVFAVARYGSRREDLQDVAKRVAEGLAATLGEHSAVQVDLRVVGVRRMRPPGRRGAQAGEVLR